MATFKVIYTEDNDLNRIQQALQQTISDIDSEITAIKENQRKILNDMRKQTERIAELERTN